MSEEPLITRWGRALDPDDPRPEHPRPQLVRPGWRSLNGRWDHAFTATGARPASWDGSIVVPFSPEAPLSGVGRQLRPDGWLWYHRTFTAPDLPAGGRLLLHLDAVDQRCTVWVDGHEAGGHVGGYLPFTLDVTDALEAGGEHRLDVRVQDLSETAPHARGKQRLDRGRIWYTAQSGIWQPVWLEPVPASYVDRVELVATLDPPGAGPRAGALAATVHAGGTPTERSVEVVLHVGGEVVARATTSPGVPVRLGVPDARPWSPDDPFLYDLDVTYGEDRVTSYAALRTVEARAGRLWLNGEVHQHVGVLDQGYWPDGLMTAPSDAAMVHDVATMKDLGFTVLRKHAKVEPLRWYHHCDRLGMMVWQDMVNGGGRYRSLVADLPARRPVPLPDRWHGVFHRDDAAGRAEFRTEVRRTAELLQACPSVVVWTVFNEGWGQFDANAITAELTALDPTRPVNGVSGWIDQGGGDIRSFHRYVRPWRLPRRNRGGRVLALTEYGGYSLRVAGHTWGDREFGYRHLDDAEGLADAFTELHRDVLAPTVPGGLAASFYTQLSDVEDELNGLLTWDREVLKVPAERVRAALATLRPPQS